MPYNIAGIPDQDIDADIKAEYGDTDNAVYAKQIASIAGEWANSQPKGSLQAKRKREIRRSMRREVGARARAEIKPVGFVETVFFWWIISGIVSFIVQRILRRMFPV